MNKQLYESFKGLSETKQADLRHRYKDSPVGLRLIEFLTTSNKADFRTADAVAYIYSADGGGAYGVLENRFFKLRKKIYDEVEKIEADKGGSNLPEEEAMLNHCKELIASGDKKEAYRLLTELEKACWERNIFELLPPVLDNMIFCNQAANDYEKNKSLYPKLEKAIELQHDLNKAIMYIRQIYEITVSKGPRYAKKLMLNLKELGMKHSAYPRFIMYYHYVSLSYKLSSMDYAGNMQVISRHLAEFKMLYAKHPLIPMVIYKANHAKIFHYQFNQVTAFIHTNHLEFEEAYEAMKQMWTLATGTDTLYRSYRSEPLYFNLFTLQCMTGRYKGAYDTCDLFAAFLKNENRLERIPLVNIMRVMLFVAAYPNTFKMDTAYLLGQADEYIKATKKTENVQLPCAQAMLIKVEMMVLLGQTKQALKLLEDKTVKLYLNSYNLNAIVNEFAANLQETGVSKKGMQEVLKKAHQYKYKATKIDQLMVLNWISAYIERITK